MRGHRVRNSILTRLRLRPTRRVKRVAPIAGSSRALVEQSSGRTDERSKRLQEANPYDRSLGDDNTERGRYPQPSREAFGRGDRPDVPQRLCTEVAARTRNCVVFPRASRTVFRTEKRKSPTTGRPCPWIVRSTAMVNHYYVYAVDRDFGPFFLKFCSYFPFNAKLCLNGHEYAKRQLARQGIAFEALDNGVLSCADPERLQKICDGLSAQKIDALLRKWLRLLPHPFTGADRKAGYRYDISILQAEFSLTQVLDRPVHGRLFFEQVIRENLDLGRPQEVRLIFNRRITRRTPGQFRTRIVTQDVTPSLNVYYKNTRIKQYHKEDRALRTETTINNSYDFGIGKGLHNLPTLAQIGCAPNRGLLEVDGLSHDCILAEDTFQAINSPVAAGRQRASGLRFADPRVHALWHAIIQFRQLLEGFRAADLRHHLAALSGRDTDAISQGAITYQLRRLRLHGLIERLPNSFRYRVTEFGFRAALFFTRLYNRLLRPGLAAALPHLRAVDAPLKRAFDKINTQVQAWIDQAQFAA